MVASWSHCMTALVRSVRSVAWECRTAWAAGWRVALSLDERCTPRRVEGHVRAVSPTDASVDVAGLSIPLDAVLAVHRPSRLGDSTWRGGAWAARRYEPPQREELPIRLQHDKEA